MSEVAGRKPLPVAPPEIKTLEELLKFPGLGESVLDFLWADEVGRLSGASRGIRQAVTEDGKLRAANYRKIFPCRARQPEDPGEDKLIAIATDLSSVYTYVDISRLKRLLVVVRTPLSWLLLGLGPGVEEPSMNLTAILAPLIPLLAGTLTALDIVVPPRTWSAEIRCSADKSILTRFAISLARLTELDHLRIPASLALHEVNAVVAGASTGVFRKLRVLKLLGIARLQDMTRESLAYRFFVQAAGAGMELGGASAQISADDTTHSVDDVQTRNAIRKFGCTLHADALRAMEDSRGAGREFWKAVVTPSIECLYFNFPVEDERGAAPIWGKECEWLWEGTKGVTTMLVNKIPRPDYELARCLPRLRALILSHTGVVQVVPASEDFTLFVTFLEGLELESLALLNVRMSTAEAGTLFGRLKDERFCAQLDPGCRRGLQAELLKELSASRDTGYVKLVGARAIPQAMIKHWRWALALRL
eukprot:g2590.t1